MSDHLTAARDRWPDARIAGRGRFAAVAHCGRRTRVTLHPTMRAAVAAMMEGNCGWALCTEHEVADLDG